METNNNEFPFKQKKNPTKIKRGISIAGHFYNEGNI